MIDELKKFLKHFKKIPRGDLKKRLLAAIPEGECLKLLDQWEFIRLRPDFKADEKTIGAPFRKKIVEFRVEKTMLADIKTTKLLEREHQKVIGHYLKKYGIAEPLPPSLTALDDEGNVIDWKIASVICNAFPRKGAIGSAEDSIYLGSGRFTNIGKRQGHQTTYTFGLKTFEQIAKEDKIPVTIDFSVPKRERDKELNAFVKSRENLRKCTSLKDPKNRLRENRECRKVYETVKKLERRGIAKNVKLWNVVAETLYPQVKEGKELQNLLRNLPRQYSKCCAMLRVSADK